MKQAHQDLLTLLIERGYRFDVKTQGDDIELLAIPSESTAAIVDDLILAGQEQRAAVDQQPVAQLLPEQPKSPTSRLPPKTCALEECSRLFVPKKRNQRYCDLRCGQRFYYLKTKPLPPSARSAK